MLEDKWWERKDLKKDIAAKEEKKKETWGRSPEEFFLGDVGQTVAKERRKNKKLGQSN